MNSLCRLCLCTLSPFDDSLWLCNGCVKALSRVDPTKFPEVKLPANQKNDCIVIGGVPPVYLKSKCDCGTEKSIKNASIKMHSTWCNLRSEDETR